MSVPLSSSKKEVPPLPWTPSFLETKCKEFNALDGLRGCHYKELLEQIRDSIKELSNPKRRKLVTNLYLINKFMPAEIWQRGSIQNLALAIIFRRNFQDQFPLLEIYCNCINEEGIDCKVKYQNLLGHIEKVINRNIPLERNKRMILRLNLIEEKMLKLIKNDPEVKDQILKLRQKTLENSQKQKESS